MAERIDGKALAESIRAQLKREAERFRSEKNCEIGLAVVLVGENPASQVYVRNKIKACEEVGIRSFAYYLNGNASEAELLELVDALNADPKVHGILVQLPLPNAGNLLLGKPCLTACTPAGCIELIKSTGTQIAGKHAVVVGRSNIVGKPMALLLLQENATVTVCHSRTTDLSEVTRQADILVVAIGRANFIKPDMVKPGAVVIDVGMNREDGKLCGDVDPAVGEIAGYLTPVPGGVGPMTITMLMKNTIKAATALYE